jgi:hypothetical protein
VLAEELHVLCCSQCINKISIINEDNLTGNIIRLGKGLGRGGMHSCGKGARVAQLAEAPCYKPEGHRFDSR